MKKIPSIECFYRRCISRNCLQNYINIGIATDTDLGLFVQISKMRTLRACLVSADEINALAAKLMKVN